MLKKILLSTCVSVSLLAAVAASHPVRAAALSESIAAAIASHPSVEGKKAAQDAAGYGVREQKSAFYPTLGASARTGRVHANDDTTRGATGADAYSWLGEGSLTLTQPLFAGFSGVNRLAAAKDRVESSAFERGTAEEDIALRASRAHLNLMRTRELLDMASGYHSEIRARRDSIDLMVREGAADQAELLQADELLMAARSGHLGFEEAYRQAEAEYIEVTGGAPGATLELGAAAAWDALLPATVDDAVAQASAQNPRVQAAGYLASALGKEAAAERGGLLPRVDAELSYLEKDQDDNLGGELMNSQAMLKMSWNFATGGAQFARVSRGFEQQREARARETEARRVSERDARQKFTSVQIVDKQFALYAEREKAAQGVLDNYLSQFEGGKQSNLQVMGAQSRLFDAKTAKTDAYYRRLLARFELLSATGRLREAFGAVPAQASAQKQ